MRPLAFIAALLVALLVPAATGRAAGDWAWPVRGQVLTEFRNGDDPYAAGQHRGIDIGAPVGTPVVAASSGTVVFAGVVGSSGLVVSQRTGDGRYELSYLHLSAVSVRRGDSVGRGDRLGAVGVSGTRSVEQPHLHFGVREADDRHAYLNPLDFLAPPPAASPDPAPVPVPVRAPAPAAPATAPVPALAAPSAAALHVPHAVGHLVHRVARPAAQVGPPHHFLAPAAHRTVPAARPSAKPHRAPGTATPDHGPAAPAVSSPNGVPAGHASAAHRHHGGVDVGWLAACAGLVLAAALLAAPRTGATRRPSARRTFGALVRAASRT